MQYTLGAFEQGLVDRVVEANRLVERLRYVSEAVRGNRGRVLRVLLHAKVRARRRHLVALRTLGSKY